MQLVHTVCPEKRDQQNFLHNFNTHHYNSWQTTSRTYWETISGTNVHFS